MLLTHLFTALRSMPCIHETAARFGKAFNVDADFALLAHCVV
jgi:hypothetical protein